MLDLVGNPEDRFSHNEAHMILELGMIEIMDNRGKKVYKVYINDDPGLI